MRVDDLAQPLVFGCARVAAHLDRNAHLGETGADCLVLAEQSGRIEISLGRHLDVIERDAERVSVEAKNDHLTRGDRAERVLDGAGS